MVTTALKHLRLLHSAIAIVDNGYSGGGPIHARVPIHAHPQFS